ncbi:MAG: TonB-dependent receptor [Woeseiaceae bacterium]|nr:TonB-dependent receptor [Woeseiaceae bacterium]
MNSDKSTRRPGFKNIFCSGTVLLWSVLLFSSGQAMAQDEAGARKSSADLLLEEIVVSARRREERLLDQPLSIAAMTGEQMQVQGIYSIDQVADYVPNVTLVTAERANNTRVIIRGIGGGFPDPVFVFGSGMYLDGHYIPSSLGGYMSTVDIERVELLRGPQGTLFGKNVIGGLVNIISTKPQAEFDSSVVVRAAEDGELGIRGMVNMPFSDKFFGRFSASREEFDGYYQNQFLNIDSGGTENTSARAAFRFLPNEDWTLDASVAVTRKRDDNAGGQCLGDPNGDAPLWGGGAGNIERRLYTGALADFTAICAADVAAGDFVNSSGKYTSSDVDEEIYQFGAAWDVNEKLNVQGKASYRNMEYRYVGDRDYTWWPVDDIGTWGPKGQHNETYGFELLFNLETNDRLRWTFGANYFDETALNGDDLCYSMYQASGALNDDPSIPPSNDPLDPGFGAVEFDCPMVGLHFDLVPDNRTSGDQVNPGSWPLGIKLNNGGPGPFLSEVSVWNKSTGIFGHVTYDLTDQWTLDAGGRWTSDDREFHNIEFATTGCDVGVDPTQLCNYTATISAFQLSDTGFSNTASGTFEKFTPSLSLTRNLAPGDTLTSGMIYFLASEGFLTGGFNTELNSNLPGAAPLLTYDPEQVWNYEVGFKGQFMGGKMQLMADVFYMDYSDQQKSLNLANPNGVYGSEDPIEVTQNIASSKIYGLEAELRASLWEGGFLSADAGYLKNEYDSYIFADPENVGQFIDNSDLQPTDFTPEWTFNLAVEHEFQMGNGGTLTPRLNMHYESGIEWGANAGGGWRKGDPKSSCYQDSYTKFDGRLTYTPSKGDWQVAAMGGNLTDERIIDYCFSTRSVWDWRLERPRWFGIEFSSHFGR